MLSTRNLKKEEVDMKFGIIQGRLTKPPGNELQWFPEKKWREEISAANELGFSFLELIDEREFNENNPLWTTSGRAELTELFFQNKCKPFSLCTDYIINHGILGDESRLVRQHLMKFIDVACELDTFRLIFPLLEKSNVSSSNIDQYVQFFRELIDYAVDKSDGKINFCLETLLPANMLLQMLEGIDSSKVTAVFDTGNRVVDQPDLASEILMLNQWIQHVHIKDKNMKGENVLLGTGLVKFKMVFEALHSIGYQGPYVFETTRGVDPIITAKYHMDLCRFFHHEASYA